MQFSKSILWLLPPWSAEIQFQKRRAHCRLGGGRRRVPDVPSLSEKVTSKLVDLKEERPRGAGRAKQFYKAKDISLSHCCACDGSLQGEGIINLLLASSLVIFGSRRALHSSLPRTLDFRHHRKKNSSSKTMCMSGCAPKNEAQG